MNGSVYLPEYTGLLPVKKLTTVQNKVMILLKAITKRIVINESIPNYSQPNSQK